MNGLEQVINGIAQNAAIANKAEEGDYIGEDGLLYCHKCHTPKQCEVKNPFIEGRIDIRYCICKCKAEEIERERIAKERYDLEDKYHKKKHWVKSDSELLSWLESQNYEISKTLIAERVVLMRKICFGEKNYEKLSKWTFENATTEGETEKIINAMKNYVDNFEMLKEQGKGLLLFGKTGRGKSYAAACVANALIDKDIPVYMTNFAKIRNTVQGLFEGKQDYFDSFNRFPLLILDDLAAESKTEYMQEIVYNVIESRLNAGLPLIVTTNLTKLELLRPTEMTHQRIFSRLLEACHPIEVTGEDKRINKLKADLKPMNDLLGL